MKRFWMVLTIFMIGVSSQVVALDLDVVTGFTGEGSPTGKFYYPLPKNFQLVAGFTAEVPGRKFQNGAGSQLNIDAILGVNAAVPLLDRVDMFFVFDDRDGIKRTGNYEKSDFYIKSFRVQKKWLYTLNERIKMGVQMTLAEVMLDDSAQINILSDVSPVMAVAISIF